MGITQFCGNFNFVYRAELHLTSGIVAVMFTMLIVSNAAFGWWLLGQRITRNFVIGTCVALSGIGLLLAHEAQLSPLGGNVWVGIVWAVLGILAASIANVVQANETGRALPMISLLAWHALWRDRRFRAGRMDGGAAGAAGPRDILDRHRLACVGGIGGDVSAALYAGAEHRRGACGL